MEDVKSEVWKVPAELPGTSWSKAGLVQYLRAVESIDEKPTIGNAETTNYISTAKICAALPVEACNRLAYVNLSYGCPDLVPITSLCA
jgi:hypothetical protein